MRPQARAARFLNKVSSGWARPVYISRHPQPPAKYIRFSEISKSLFTCIVKINNLTVSRDLGYSGIMKAQVNFEWRKKDEPDTPAEFYIRTALKAAGYTVGHVAVQGVWDEDKPKIPGGKWDETRLPHEEIAK